MNNEILELDAAVWNYLNGVYSGDTKMLGGVFHSNSHIYSVFEGSSSVIARDSWFERVAGRPSSESLGHARTDKVLSLDIIGTEMALAKVQLSRPPAHFVDYLCFAKIAGSWRIISKVFHQENRTS